MNNALHPIDAIDRFMYREKKKEEDLTALKIAWRNQYEPNITITRTRITRKGKEKQENGYFNQQTDEFSLEKT